MFNRSKVAEQALGSFLPAKIQGSEPQPGKVPVDGNRFQEAIEFIERAKDRLGQPVTMTFGRGKYGRQGHTWKVFAGEFSGQDESFIAAVGKFLADVYGIDYEKI